METRIVTCEGLGGGAPFPCFFEKRRRTVGWKCLSPQTRLVPHTWNDWKGTFPVHEPSAIALEGELLRFVFP